jgi:C-terminal processing protease CtpA/Prc
LKECGVFGVSSDEYLDYALRNRNEWSRKGKDVLKTMMEGVVKDAMKKGLKRMDSVDEDGQESSDSECSVSRDVMADITAAPASGPIDVATTGEEVEADSTKPTSPWIVLAPPGKLGIVIDTTVEGPVVHRVSDGSVMKHKLAPGDVITSIDGVKTEGLAAVAVHALMSARAQHQRKFTVQSSQSN